LSHLSNCSIFSTDLRKLLQTYFIKTRSLAEELFHSDTQTDERTDEHKNANNFFSQAFLRF